MPRRPLLSIPLRALVRCVLAVCIWAGACKGDRPMTGPENSGIDEAGSPVDAAGSPLMVSDPALSVALPDGGFAAVLPGDRDALGLAAGLAGFSNVTFVSLPPGAIPSATNATIRNRRTGSSGVVELAAGGFDPVSVEAVEDDTIDVDVRRLDDPAPLRILHRVPAKRRPKVLRTNPPQGKRDVALNSRVTIIFSEPMDARTLAAAPVRLFRAEAEVAGHVEFEDPNHVIAAFVPNEPLMGGSSYRLVVTEDIYDLDGEPLEGAVEATFTSTPAPQVVARLSFTVQPIATLAGRSIAPAVQVSAQDALGNVATDFTGTVTIALGASPSGGTLAGTTSAAAVSGVATFTNLIPGTPGSGYRLTAVTPGVPEAMSATFDVHENAGVVYFNDFEGVVGQEWSHSLRSSVLDENAHARGILGEFGCADYAQTGPKQSENCRAADLVTLALSDLPEHDELTITFDLYVMWSWDGNAGLWAGDEDIAPDVFNVAVEGGPTLLNSSFAVHPSRSFQSYPATYPSDGSTPPDNDQNAGALETIFGDIAVYRLTFTLPHSSPSIAFRFTAPSLQEIWDESWALDNVEVKAKRQPR